MSERYLVRCAAAQGRAMAGMYAAGLTRNGMIATWKHGRARRFDNESVADDVADHLATKFAGTVWVVEQAEVVQ